MWIAAALLYFFQSAGPAADGLKALDEHRYEAAVESSRKAIEADPADYAAHFNLAVAYGFLNQDDAGIAEYRKTLELKPGLYAAETNAGLLLLRQKRPAEALPLFEDASRQKPQDFAASRASSTSLIATKAFCGVRPRSTTSKRFARARGTRANSSSPA